VRACVVQRKEEKRKFTTLMGTKFCFGFLVQKMLKINKGYLLNFFSYQTDFSKSFFYFSKMQNGVKF
jgi:hypothetical protein